MPVYIQIIEIFKSINLCLSFTYTPKRQVTVRLVNGSDTSNVFVYCLILIQIGFIYRSKNIRYRIPHSHWKKIIILSDN